MSTLVELGPALAVALVLLAVLAAAVSRAAGLGHDRAVLVAAVRAVVQLGAVAVVLVAVVESLALTAIFVLGMFLVASRTAGYRLTHAPHAWWAALPVGVGALPVAAALVAAGIVPLEGIAVVPIAGILIGGAMTATVLAGRRGLDELSSRRGEVEAGMALGLLPRDAALEVVRPSAGQALVPALDQTRTVGLVALPGAFVGTLLGGATPVEAGAVQVLVLVALLAVQAVAVAATVELVASGRLHAEGGGR